MKRFDFSAIIKNYSRVLWVKSHQFFQRTEYKAQNNEDLERAEELKNIERKGSFHIIQREVDLSVEGVVDDITPYSIDGWLAKKEGDLQKLQVYLDGKEQIIHLLPINREDVNVATGFSVACGFNIIFSQALAFTDQKHKLVIKECNNDSELLSIEFIYTYQAPQSTASGITAPMIDVIVPVYLGVEETLNCLQSVVNAKNKVEYRLVVINDCSPDKEIHKALQKFKEDNPNITLDSNPENLGFVKTVNKGMKLSTDNDVVLLNSDTEVSDFWLDKLHAVLKREANVGTVTPFSNQASIFSLPVMNPTVDLPEFASIHSINQQLAKYNDSVIHDVPTAHGFCMMIRRSTMQNVGYFDEEKWGKGYCEENDFSIRATLKGWRNVIACDTYVKHIGSISFQEESSVRINHNLSILNELYPFYLGQVGEFINADPLNQYRQPLLEEALIEKYSSTEFVILHIIHSRGGGTEYAMRTFIDNAKAEGVSSLVLRSEQRGRVWRIESEDQSILMDYPVIKGTDCVANILQKVGVSHIHYHQLIDFDDNIRTLPDLLSCPYDISLHDYYLICAKINLLNEESKLCSGPAAKKCFSCVNVSGSQSNINLSDQRKIEDFYHANSEFVKSARYNIAPTKGVKKLFLEHIETNNIIVKAHPEKATKRSFIKKSNNKIVNVAILGAIGEHKGSKLLEKLVEFSDKNKLPLRFIVIGYGTAELEAINSKKLVFTGAYELEMLPKLIAKYQCDRSLFISPWPETFSYTLSEALQLGLYPFAFNFGAYKDRLEEYDVGTLLPLNSSESDICEILQTTLTNKGRYSFGANYPSFIKDYYNLDKVMNKNDFIEFNR